MRWYENGTRYFIGTAKLHESLSTLLRIGIKSIEEHVFDLSDMLMAELQSMGMTAYVAGERGERGGIISIRVPDADGLSRKLAHARIEAAVRQGTCESLPASL